MGIFSSMFRRKQGGTRVGRIFRSLISAATSGLSDAAGLTDGHMVDGKPENGEYSY